MCQALSQARWIEGRIERLLPVDYFHVVFTVPNELLNSLAMRNRKVFFDALFTAGSQTLLTLGEDTKRLGAQMGLTAVLHTWTRDLRFHPHLHCIVTGGGLSSDGTRWKSCKQDYLFPVSVLSKLFRGKMVSLLDEAYRDGKLNVRHVEGFGHAADDIIWRRLKRKLYKTKWVSYAKRPFAGAETVYQYLGRYTHRVGISNQRLISANDDGVTFRTRGEQTVTIPPEEFLRRFLTHVLPYRFVKLRHYGLMAPRNVTTKLETARAALKGVAGKPSTTTPPPVTNSQSEAAPTWAELLRRLTGIDVTRCRQCGGPITLQSLPQVALLDTS